MAEVQIKRLSHKHEEILMYMVANPNEKLGEVAARFDLTQPHLSIIIHSDIFQEELRKKLDGVWHPMMESINSRLSGMAHLVLDKLGEQIENDKLTPGQLLEANDSVLDRLGYGPKPARNPGEGGTNIYIGTVPQNVLSQARETFGRRIETINQGVEQHDGEKERTPTYEELQTRRDGNLDEARLLPVVRAESAEVHGEKEGGD